MCVDFVSQKRHKTFVRSNLLYSLSLIDSIFDTRSQDIDPASLELVMEDKLISGSHEILLPLLPRVLGLEM